MQARRKEMAEMRRTRNQDGNSSIPRASIAWMLTVAFFIIAPLVSATTVTVTDVTGTAQYRVGSGGWQSIRVDDRLSTDAEIVTSVQAGVTIDAAGNEILIGGLSRVRISELVQSAGEIRTRVELPYGRMSAEVRSGANRGNDFSVSTPIATAAVRGTEFTFSGYELGVSHGDVELANQIGQTHSVRAGQLSRAYGVQGIQSVEQTLRERTLLRE
jgi:hypothetical protein